jgi:acyl-CoA thioesterase-1
MLLLMLLAATSIQAAAPAASGGNTILVYGDSLSAAYGISQKEGWVTLLQDRLRKSGADYTVANASISGETTSGGASRIKAALARHKPKVTVIALGANDGLRGLPVKQMRANLETMIGAAQQAGSKVVLVGMRLPPNYGPAYTKEFDSAFADLARRYKLAFAPFLLDGIGEKSELFQSDQLHPTAAAQPRLLENVWKALKAVL